MAESTFVKDKVVIVTGSTGGFGKEIATCLALGGARVVVTSRKLETAQKVVQQIIADGGNALACQFRLEIPEDAEKLIETTGKHYTKLDVLINNAVSHDTLPPLPVQFMNLEQLQAGLAANVQNVLWLTSKAYPYLKDSKGLVLNIGSAVVNRHPLGIPLYTIAKGALQQITKVLAAEWASDGIRVNQINPGFSESDAHKSIGITKDEIMQLLNHYKQFHALNRIGQPKDIASIVCFLLSDKASWMSGSIVDIDGGYSVQGIAGPLA